jgi:hypothetical protein
MGLVGGVIAEYLPYALPFQGQAYRTLWLLQFIQIPLGVALLRFVWSRGTEQSRRWAIPIAGAFSVAAMSVLQILSATGLSLVSYMRGTGGNRVGKPLSFGLTIALIIACIAPLFVPITVWLDPDISMPSALDLWRFVPPIIGPLYMFLGACVLLVGLFRWTGGGSRFCAVALASSFAIHSAFFAMQIPALSGGEVSSHAAVVQTLREFLGERYASPDRLPTVYWPQAGLDDIWVELPAICYFTKQQTAGNMFNRDTAVEGQRRANLVGSFELSEFHRRLHSRNQWFEKSMMEVFRDHIGRGDPTLDDLYALCEEDVDLVIVRHEFDELYSIKVGPFFVYECAKIREPLRERRSRAAGQETKTVAHEF